MEGDVLIGHPHAQHRAAAIGPEGGFGLGAELPVGVVITELRIATGGQMAGGDLLRGGEGFVE